MQVSKNGLFPNQEKDRFFSGLFNDNDRAFCIAEYVP